MKETWHPLGVVGVIPAFNFPVAVWLQGTALALVCQAILEPSCRRQRKAGLNLGCVRLPLEKIRSINGLLDNWHT